MHTGRIYICIDLKSYYASVECVHRGLDPLKAKLLVADESRSDQTICLAVSPALKAMGVPGRPRLFEAKQAIRRYEATHGTKEDYIIAVPRMAEYVRISSLIYSIYLRYAAPEDVHIYSIDECFIDSTAYLHFYRPGAGCAQPAALQAGAAEASGAQQGDAALPAGAAEAAGARQGHAALQAGAAEAAGARQRHAAPGAADTEAARLMAMRMIRAVLKETGITATAGIGTNMYLAKVAMDIVAKKSAPDKDGVRIAVLDEDSYKLLLWEHKPLTDFWQIGPGKARRLYNAYMYTMGDVAERTLCDEEWFYKSFGIDAEILIDHAWGVEPVTMAQIKHFRSDAHSLSSGQVLPHPYEYDEAENVLREMIDSLCADMLKKRLVSCRFSWWVSYDFRSLEKCPLYNGPLSVDFYGRLHPKHTSGTIRLPVATNSLALIEKALAEQFAQKTDHRLLFRRLGVCAENTARDEGMYQLDLFTDYASLHREERIRQALLAIRRKFGANAVFKGINLLDGATALERNGQIGGHRA